MRFAILLLCGMPLIAEDAPKPNPELDAAKARITKLEAALAAIDAQGSACLNALTGIFSGHANTVGQLRQALATAPAPQSTAAQEQLQGRAAKEPKPLPPASTGTSEAAPVAGSKP